MAKPTSPLRSLLLCSVLFSLASPTQLMAQSTAPHSAREMHKQAAMDAYKKRRQLERKESYRTRKVFPPPKMVDPNYSGPLRLNIPNINAPMPPSRPVITRHSPAYHRFATPKQKPSQFKSAASQPPSVTTSAAATNDGGDSLIDTISDELETILTAIVPADEPPARRQEVAQLPEPAPKMVATRQEPLITLDDAQLVNPETYARSLPAYTAAPPPPAPPAQYASAKPIKREDTQPQTLAKPVLKSPGIVIKRERVQMPLTPDVIASATPEQLAAYAPAAGGADGVNAPLIQLPQQPAATPPPVQAPVPKTTAIEPDAKALPTPTQEELEEVQQIIESTPDPVILTEQPGMLPDLTQPAPSAQPTQPKSQPAPKVSKPKPQPAPPITEPVPELSKGSQRVVRQMRPIADEQPREPEAFTIDRTKDVGDVFDAEISAEHEAEGVNITIKKPSLNVTYELEKAYNALTNGQTSTARSIYELVLANNPDNIDALFGLATIYHRARQLEEARSLYSKILAVNPSHRNALNNFLVLLADEAPQAALRQLEALEKRSPGFSPIPAQMAVIHQKLGQPEQASKAMFRAVSLAPENLTYRYNLAVMLDSQGNKPEATRLYSQLVQAHSRGESIPGNITQIQERLTFLRSNIR